MGITNMNGHGEEIPDILNLERILYDGLKKVKNKDDEEKEYGANNIINNIKLQTDETTKNVTYHLDQLKKELSMPLQNSNNMSDVVKIGQHEFAETIKKVNETIFDELNVMKSSIAAILHTNVLEETLEIKNNFDGLKIEVERKQENQEDDLNEVYEHAHIDSL